MDPHRRERLQRRVGETRMPTEVDRFLDRRHVERVEATGARIYRRSRWLNGVSVLASPEELEQLRALDFVSATRPVGVWRRATEIPPPRLQTTGSESFDEPLALLGVPAAIQRDLDGEGVRIAVFDTGFETDHPALAQVAIWAERDFINNDDDTGFADSPLEACESCNERSKQLRHGVAVLSLIAGIDPESGERIGPAPGATLILAKTENNFSETQLEEDNYVAALEWADSLGADVVSSSLGYLDFDEGIGDYDPLSDLDGRTTISARGVRTAARLGILVCTAAGNEGPAPSTLITPADADSILAVGAVELNGNTASFSSHGPTSDDRIKPDLVAPGVGLGAANYDFSASADFISFSGTSAATPLMAGCAALVLQARPLATAEEARQALLRSGDRASEVGIDNALDNARGWGIPDLCRALSGDPGSEPGSAPKNLAVRVFPQPSSGDVQIVIDSPFSDTVRARIFDSSGTALRSLDPVDIPAGRNVSSCALLWDGRNDRGESVAGGIYFLVIQTQNGTARTRIARLR